jgi:hypothetical protein
MRISSRFQVERLGNVIVGAALHGLHCRLDGRVAGDDDDDGFGATTLDLAEDLKAAGARESKVEQHDIDAGGFNHAESMLGVVGDVGGETKSLGHFLAAVANGALIIDDEKVQQVRFCDFSSRGRPDGEALRKVGSIGAWKINSGDGAHRETPTVVFALCIVSLLIPTNVLSLNSDSLLLRSLQTLFRCGQQVARFAD